MFKVGDRIITKTLKEISDLRTDSYWKPYVNQSGTIIDIWKKGNKNVYVISLNNDELNHNRDYEVDGKYYAETGWIWRENMLKLYSLNRRIIYG